MSWASDLPGRLPVEVFLDKSNWEETPWQPQNTLEGLYIPTGLGTPQDPPGGAEDVADENDIWAFWLNLASYRHSFTVYFYPL